MSLSTPDIFLSYNREDAARAKLFADAFAAEGFAVWWDAHLRSGEEYDRVTEAALRNARAVVVLWSKRSVDSSWVRAEATQAHRARKLMPAMIEDCVRPVMFELTQTAELSHWKGDRKDPAWQAFVNDLSDHVGKNGGSAADAVRPASEPKRRRAVFAGAVPRAAAAAVLALVAVAGAWWWFRPAPAAAHSMMVRQAGFKLLSADLAANLPATVEAEIAAAFNADGVVGVSTAAAPAPGPAPAYALGGTIQRDGNTIRVITNLTNERTGAALWSDTFDYDASEAPRVPRYIAVDAGNVVRCGLFGASTYRKALPDAVMRDYMQFCQWEWDTNLAEGRRALVPAQRVVAAVPDFSWGWAAVAGAYWKVAGGADDEQFIEQAQASGRDAADRAVAIDSRNSEALYIKAMLVDWKDWAVREDLFRRAVAARRLDCGCEHHQYGLMLANVGRTAEGVEQLRQANDMLALYLYTPLTLAQALVAEGKPNDAKPYFDAAIQLTPDRAGRDRLAAYAAMQTDDAKALADPKLPLPEDLRAAWLAGHRAIASGNAAAKAQAVQALLALDQDQQDESVARLLAELGATHDAFRIASRSASRAFPGPLIFWNPAMRETLRDPGFPALAAQLGLMKYWKASHTRPDVCQTKDAPPFCRMI
jgi:hypothetical protein